MFARVILLSLSLGPLAGILAGQERKGDLSDPSSTLLTLTAAVLNGDVDTVKQIYTGDDKSVIAAANAATGRKEALRKFAESLERQYGKNIGALYGSGFDLNSRGLDVKLGGIPLTSFLLSFKLKATDTDAVFSPPELIFGQDELVLVKKGKNWNVTKFLPMGGTEAFLNMEATAYKEIVVDIEKNKLKAYEIPDAFTKKWKSGLQQLGPGTKIVP